jgi:hypothetical protein
LREFGGAAEFGGGDFAEDEAVVPLAAGLLQCFELGGQAVGCDGGARGGFGKVASELGPLADFVQLGGGVRGFGGCVRFAVTAVPVADERDQIGFGERERARGGECVEQLREDAGKIVALLVENLEQVLSLFVAGAFEMAAEAAGFAAQDGAVRRRRGAGGCGLCANEVALDVDVTDLAGSLAQALEQAEGFALLLVVRRESGEHGEQDELRFDAAGRGTEAMDRLRAGVGKAGQHRGRERPRQFAESLYGARRWSCWGHSIWAVAV